MPRVSAELCWMFYLIAFTLLVDAFEIECLPYKTLLSGALRVCAILQRLPRGVRPIPDPFCCRVQMFWSELCLRYAAHTTGNELCETVRLRIYLRLVDSPFARVQCLQCVSSRAYWPESRTL